MGIILACGLVISIFLRMFCSIEGDFAFDALTIVLIIGMIYHLKSSNNIKLMEVVLLGSSTILTLIVSIIILTYF